MFTDFDYGIIQSCLARPTLYQGVKKTLDEVYKDWLVYLAMTECVGLSGKSFDYDHDIFYQVLKSKTTDAQNIIDKVNSQQVPHETLVNRVKLLYNKYLTEELIRDTDNILKVLKDNSKQTAKKWELWKKFCVNSMSKFNEESSIKEASQYADDLLDLISDNASGINTGYHALDSVTRGICENEFIIVAGAPSMGKTSFAVNMATNMAMSGKKILFFTIEMAAKELMERVFCTLSLVDVDTIKAKKITAQQQARINAAVVNIGKMNMKIIDKGKLCVSDISSAIETSYLGTKPDVVFIDYIQLMQDDNGAKDQYQKVTNISNALKQLSNTTGVPIVAVAQLSRKVTDNSRPHRPRMSDLKDSGSLEQDANKILLLHRDDYYNRQKSQSAQMDGRAVVIVDKNRQGRCADVLFTWIPEYFLFKEECLYGQEASKQEDKLF